MIIQPFLVVTLPDNEKAVELYKNGITTFHEKKFDEALKMFNDAVAEEPDFGVAYHNAGICAQRTENFGLALEKHLKALGVQNGFAFFQGRYKGMFPQEEERIRESWKRVFQIDNWTIFNVCGNIWEIRKEWIRQIVRPGESLEGLPY